MRGGEEIHGRREGGDSRPNPTRRGRGARPVCTGGKAGARPRAPVTAAAPRARRAPPAPCAPPPAAPPRPPARAAETVTPGYFHSSVCLCVCVCVCVCARARAHARTCAPAPHARMRGGRARLRPTRLIDDRWLSRQESRRGGGEGTSDFTMSSWAARSSSSERKPSRAAPCSICASALVQLHRFFMQQPRNKQTKGDVD